MLPGNFLFDGAAKKYVAAPAKVRTQQEPNSQGQCSGSKQQEGGTPFSCNRSGQTSTREKKIRSAPWLGASDFTERNSFHGPVGDKNGAHRVFPSSAGGLWASANMTARTFRFHSGSRRIAAGFKIIRAKSGE